MDFKESRVPIAFFLVGAALVLIGHQIPISVVMNLGFVCIGLAIIASGIEMLVTGRAIFRTTDSWGPTHYERFSGLRARMWGVLFLVFGGFVGLSTLAGMLLPGGAETFWAQFLSTPRGWGILFVGMGAVAMTYGIIRILAGSALLGSGLGAQVLNCSERVFGAVVMLLGLGLAMLGWVFIVAPDVLLTPINHVLQSIPTPPIPPTR